jgi:putative peptidoglycan lipid II flippase
MNAGLLAAVLWRRGLWRPDARLKRRAWRILAAAAVMAGALIATAQGLAGLFAAGGAPRVLALIALVAVGGVAYAVAAQLSGAARVSDAKALLRRQPTAAGPAAPAD